MNLNPIAIYDATHFRVQIGKSEQKLRIYAVLKKVCRIALPLLGFSFLLSFGLLNPSYLPISSALLFFSYAPCMDVTIGTLESWTKSVNETLAKQKAILKELEGGKTIFEAWIAAIPDHEPPPEPSEKKSPTPEARMALYDYQLALALIKLQNARRKVERAYIKYIQNNKTDQRSLEAFGTFQTWHIELLMRDGPFDVFVTDKKRYTNEDDFSKIFNDTHIE
ncbi:MAG: hypothetical protein KDK71_08960 [Chlamydiia bacterium]|nr:hypothetical protein [Chlamydiia bacterium]